MKAGQTNIDVHTRVRIKNMKGEDKELNGLTGSVTHPFAFGETGKNWLGVWLDPKASSPYGGKLNVRTSEIEIIGYEEPESPKRIGNHKSPFGIGA